MEGSNSPKAVIEGSTDPQQFAFHDQLQDSELIAMAGLGGPGSRTSSASANGNTQHPNVFVRGLPLAWNEPEISGVFGQFGTLSSIRLVRHSMTKQSLGYGFVRFQDHSEAQTAIKTLDGHSVMGHTLQVKLADADAGPPSTSNSSGLTPSDSCYVKHLPATYGVIEVTQMFEPHGAVMDVKLFPCLDQFRGASALVRMASIEAAERAINSLNGQTPPGGMQGMIVRFAESATEKAARLTRRERQQQQLLQRNILGLGGLDPMQLQQAIAALNLNSGLTNLPTGAPLNSIAAPTSRPAMIQGQFQQQVQSSICIKGMPANADRLWMYENFARFGGIAGMRILIDEQTGLCNGTGFINYSDNAAAERARSAMNGMRAGEKILQVMIQNQQRPQGAGLGNNGAVGGLTGASPPPMVGDWQQLLQPGNPGAMVW